MKCIHIQAIKVAADRQRKLFDPAKLHEFADGIQSKGLLHPIVLRMVGDDYYLVAGERRLRAVTDIYDLGGSFMHDGQMVVKNSIPYTLLSDLDPLAAEEAELDENIQRENLTWQERAAAHARLLKLRQAQAVQVGAAPPSVADISVEVRGSAEGVNQENTRRELIVARHLGNPAVQAAKTVDEAYKILKKEEAQTKSRDLGVSVGRTFSSSMHRAFNEDSLAWMREAPAGQFDVILTDSPYGMGADTFGDSGGVAAGAHGYADTPELYESILRTCEKELYRLAKDQAHMYWFCDIDKFADTRERFRAAGWQVFRTPLIWYKKTGMRAPWPENGPQRKFETILYAVKGKRPVLKMLGDVLEYGPDSNEGHAAQKPVALLRDLLSRSALPGNTVFDPFVGSGSTIVAAHELKCIATGIEIDTASYGIVVNRISKLSVQADLDAELGL